VKEAGTVGVTAAGPDPQGFPLGRAVSIEQLEADPYPFYAQLQRAEPISWIAALGMWWVTRYEDVRAIAMDDARFTTAFDRSLIFDTFGRQMLTTEGDEHDRYRRAVQQSFAPGFVRRRHEAAIHAAAGRLIGDFRDDGEVELRAAFAARLPVVTMLELFGMPLYGEPSMRRWYDAFERALANYAWNEDVRRVAQVAVREFHAYLDAALRGTHGPTATGLLAALANAPAGERLTDEEIRRNATIIFFGGISTVEALILNALWALFHHPEILARARAEPDLLSKVIDETIRWAGPVQSATRHVLRDTTYGGVEFAAGDVVNCMLGAANRDPDVFPQPERFDIDRPNLQRHLSFAMGRHSCLGLHLARAEARIAVERLLAELPGLRLIAGKSSPPAGYEFRQPRALHVAWDSRREPR
jgi:cytochrome P450